MLVNWSFILETSSTLVSSYQGFLVELIIGSIKSISYFILVSDVSETSAIIYTYTFLLLFTKNIQSFNCECWNQNFSEAPNILITVPLIYDNITLFKPYIEFRKQVYKMELV